MALYVITGSATATGHPIYLDPASEWSESLAKARTFATEAERDEALERARGDEARCCDPYPIEVRVEAGQIHTTSLRERIRAEGPTTPIPGLRRRRPSAA